MAKDDEETGRGVLTIRTSKSLLDRLREQARDERRTVTAVVELALENYLDINAGGGKKTVKT